MNCRLVHVFWETNMSCGHDGLARIAAKKRLHIKDLAPGELVCFINRKQDRIKVLAGTAEEDGHGVMGYYRSPRGRIEVAAIQYIADSFLGGAIDYDSALRKTLTKNLSAEVMSQA
jgi:hypothetical protein